MTEDVLLPGGVEDGEDVTGGMVMKFIGTGGRKGSLRNRKNMREAARNVKLAALSRRDKGHPGNELVIEARVALVSKLAMTGLTQTQIAEKIGVSLSIVGMDLKEARRRWLESSMVSYDSMKAGELAKVNEVERQQWDEIDRLQGYEDEDSQEPQKAWWYKRYNAAWGRVMWCVEQRCKLFGLYAPQEVINWKAEALQHGVDPEQIYRILVHEMSNIIDGTVVEPEVQELATGEGEKET